LSPPPVEKAAPPARQPEAAGLPAQAAPVKPLVTPAPQRAASVPVSPASGRIIWIGRLQKNEELEINGKSCSTGTLIGELPGKPVKFSVSPGNLSNDGIVLYTANPDYANNVIESPGARNGWNKTTYTWNPKYANDVTVQETPAAQNQWNRVALHSKNPKISVIVIDWSLVN
jgi:phosphatidylserine decarboxylase